MLIFFAAHAAAGGVLAALQPPGCFLLLKRGYFRFSNPRVKNNILFLWKGTYLGFLTFYQEVNIDCIVSASCRRAARDYAAIQPPEVYLFGKGLISVSQLFIKRFILIVL